ncbi:MAG TPA: hypothetical protein VM533_06335 [Fimbriiglobus sp.]|jgi:hypothetical protein|nr:hypothetical protein [Fimbriiglobus sp.]
MRITPPSQANLVPLLVGLVVLALRFATLLPVNGGVEFRHVGRVLMAVCELRPEQFLG